MEQEGSGIYCKTGQCKINKKLAQDVKWLHKSMEQLGIRMGFFMAEGRH